MKSKKIRLIAKGLFSVLGISGFCFSAQGATGIQGCLENYQRFDQAEENRVDQHNQEVETDRVASVMPPFRHIHGPGHYFTDSQNGGTREANPFYILSSFFTGGAIPLVHYGVIGSYEITRHGVPLMVNAGHAIRARIKKKKFDTGYERVIQLIQEFIQDDNPDSVIRSESFREISRNSDVKKVYPHDSTIYAILIAAFEQQLVCGNGAVPHSLSRIISDLKNRYLEREVVFSDGFARGHSEIVYFESENPSSKE